MTDRTSVQVVLRWPLLPPYLSYYTLVTPAEALRASRRLFPRRWHKFATPKFQGKIAKMVKLPNSRCIPDANLALPTGAYPADMTVGAPRASRVLQSGSMSKKAQLPGEPPARGSSGASGARSFGL